MAKLTHQESVQSLTSKLHDLRDLTPKNRRRIEKLLTELANAHDREGLETFRQAWPLFCAEAVQTLAPGMLKKGAAGPEWFGDDEILPCLWFLSDLLRRLWSAGDEVAVATAEQILLNISEITVFAPLRLDWRRAAFVYQPRTELQCALMTLAQACDRSKICRNRDCKKYPYFIGDRSDQAYCSDACFAVARRQSRLAWWEEFGPEWRAARRKAESKRTRKPKRS